ncbi:MAG: rhombotarget lipoprotein [Verrucomicrobia bacterium]|nr:rhombotarget lipoprotein [Verrucomicrobiota bacterium]
MKPPSAPIRSVAVVIALLVSLFLAGCAAMVPRGPRKSEKSSSVVEFLYPRQTEPLITPGIPVLKLPLRVGLAFVPSSGGRGGYSTAGDFSEKQKSALLQRVAEEFKANAFIQSIDVIPATYLRAGGGFENLDQVRGLLGLDVVALVAFDQIQFTQENKLSLAYWTIVGAYLFKGNKNDTHTLLEAVVYDIPSRKLLFRAPGASQMLDTSTMVEVRERLRQASANGFDKATDDLIANLKVQLDSFRERVKSAPAGQQVARIEHRPGYRSGGGLDAWFAGGLAVLALTRWLSRRRA